MRIAAHRGSRVHAPENSLAAFVSAYVAGAGVLEFDLQLTKDHKLVLSHDGDTKRVTGEDGKIIGKTLAELKELDWSETYAPPGSEDFSYYTDPKRLLAPLVFPDVLNVLPEDAELLIELKHDSSLDTGLRDVFVAAACDGIEAYDAVARTVVYSKDRENLKAVRARLPGIRVAAFDFTLSLDDQLKLLEETGADGLVTALENVIENGQLTDFGKALKKVCADRKLVLGAVLYPRETGTFTKEEYEALRGEGFVWSASTDSMLAARAIVAREVLHVDDKFSGKKLDRDSWALGYAKANKYAEVKVDDGVHLVIDEYDAPFPSPSPDALERRLRRIEEKSLFTAKDWPYYSGGGVGYTRGIRGDFSAELDYLVEKAGQATTLEMAVLNVDPGAHMGTPPKTFRDKDSFYDPHGAPPYVGVEQDEDDGFRINWNLGSEYDNNQYGKPVGDGKKSRGAKLRLERRGPYFAAYLKDSVDANGTKLGPEVWVCVGVARNDSLNPVVYLRCVGKRWRQENEVNPSEFMPILSNHFTFRRVTIRRHYFH